MVAAGQEALFELFHARSLVGALVVVADKVEESVHNEQCHVVVQCAAVPERFSARDRQADDEVTECAGSHVWRGEGQDVRWPALPAVLRIQSGRGLPANQGHGQFRTSREARELTPGAPQKPLYPRG